MGLFSGCKKSVTTVKQPNKSSSSEKQPTTSSSSEKQLNPLMSSNEQPKHNHDLKVTLHYCLACEGCYEKVKNNLMKDKGTVKVDLVKKEDYDLFIRVTTSTDPETICMTIKDNKKVKVKSAELINPDKGTVRQPPVNSATASGTSSSTTVAAPGKRSESVSAAPTSSTAKPKAVSGKAIPPSSAPSKSTVRPPVTGSTGPPSSNDGEQPQPRTPNKGVSLPAKSRQDQPSATQGGNGKLTETSVDNGSDKAPSRMPERATSRKVASDANKPLTSEQKPPVTAK